MAMSHVLARTALPAQLRRRPSAWATDHVASHSPRVTSDFTPLLRASRAASSKWSAQTTGLRAKPPHGSHWGTRRRLAPCTAVEAAGDAVGLAGDRVRAEGEKRRAGEHSGKEEAEGEDGDEEMSEGEGEEEEDEEEYEEDWEDEDEWDEDWDDEQAEEGGGEVPEWEGEGVEVGVIVGAHGLRGELRVKPLTDFPEQRFGQGGWRWLKRPGRQSAPSPAPAPAAAPPPPAAGEAAGEATAGEAAAAEQRGASMRRVWVRGGRPGPGRYGLWLVRLKDVESTEQAEALRGSVMMVREEDRPELAEDEVYSSDLIGLSVLLKEGGAPIGVVEDVYSGGGAGELLRVRLHTGEEPAAGSEGAAGGEAGRRAKGQGEGKKKQGKGGGGKKGSASGGAPCVWVPFVRAIVPEVNLKQRHLVVDPPPGLLDLNQRPASKAEPTPEEEGDEGARKGMSARERKKRQQRRRQVEERYGQAGQQHVLHWVHAALQMEKAAAEAGAGEEGAGSARAQGHMQGHVDVDAVLQQLLAVDLRRVAHAVHSALTPRAHTVPPLPQPVPLPHWPLLLARSGGEAALLGGAASSEGAGGGEGMEGEGRRAVGEGAVAVVALLGAAAAADAVREGSGSGAGGGAAGMARRVEEYVRRDMARLRRQMGAVDAWREGAESSPLPWLLVVDETASPLTLHQSLLDATAPSQPTWIPLPQWPLLSLNPPTTTPSTPPPPPSSPSPDSASSPPPFHLLLRPLPRPEAEPASSAASAALQGASGGGGGVFLALKDAAVLRGLAKQGVKHLLVLLHPTAQPDPSLIAACIQSNADVAVAASASSDASSAGVQMESGSGGQQQVLRVAAVPCEQQEEGHAHGEDGNGSGAEDSGKKKGKGKGKGKGDERQSSGVRLQVLEGCEGAEEAAAMPSHVHSLVLHSDQLVVSMKFLKSLDPMQLPFQLFEPSPLEQRLPTPHAAAEVAAGGEAWNGAADGGVAMRQRAMDVVSAPLRMLIPLVLACSPLHRYCSASPRLPGDLSPTSLLLSSQRISHAARSRRSSSHGGSSAHPLRTAHPAFLLALLRLNLPLHRPAWPITPKSRSVTHRPCEIRASALPPDGLHRAHPPSPRSLAPTAHPSDQGNLKAAQWEEVTSRVNARGGGSKAAKTVVQCRMKLDSLKKKYKAERLRWRGLSRWEHYKKLDQLIGGHKRVAGAGGSSAAAMGEDLESSGVGGGGGMSSGGATLPATPVYPAVASAPAAAMSAGGLGGSAMGTVMGMPPADGTYFLHNIAAGGMAGRFVGGGNGNGVLVPSGMPPLPAVGMGMGGAGRGGVMGASSGAGGPPPPMGVLPGVGMGGSVYLGTGGPVGAGRGGAGGLGARNSMMCAGPGGAVTNGDGIKWSAGPMDRQGECVGEGGGEVRGAGGMGIGGVRLGGLAGQAGPSAGAVLGGGAAGGGGGAAPLMPASADAFPSPPFLPTGAPPAAFSGRPRTGVEGGGDVAVGESPGSTACNRGEGRAEGEEDEDDEEDEEEDEEEEGGGEDAAGAVGQYGRAEGEGGGGQGGGGGLGGPALPSGVGAAAGAGGERQKRMRRWRGGYEGSRRMPNGAADAGGQEGGMGGMAGSMGGMGHPMGGVGAMGVGEAAAAAVVGAGEDSVRSLAEAISSFGELYARVEVEKQRYLMALEQRRMEFQREQEARKMEMLRDMEVRRMEMDMKFHLELAKLASPSPSPTTHLPQPPSSSPSPAAAAAAAGTASTTPPAHAHVRGAPAPSPVPWPLSSPSAPSQHHVPSPMPAAPTASHHPSAPHSGLAHAPMCQPSPTAHPAPAHPHSNPPAAQRGSSHAASPSPVAPMAHMAPMAHGGLDSRPTAASSGGAEGGADGTEHGGREEEGHSDEEGPCGGEGAEEEGQDALERQTSEEGDGGSEQEEEEEDDAEAHSDSPS
ncbi:unnamed protein product [Closterium sp. Naga37s-1]|nr:unnamed protein product [Closterium sp. Naga37s-1]